jgi:serine protein kinase
MTTTLSETTVHRDLVGLKTSTHRGSFIDDLTAFATQHQAQHWRGTFAEFLHDILPKDPSKLTRSSHQYVYDMLCAYRDAPRVVRGTGEPEPTATALFAGELFGIDSALERVIDYFKAAAAGTAVGRQVFARDPAEAGSRGIQPHR